MNEYKIDFSYPESDVETAYIVERTEGAARKALSKRFGKEAEITNIEIVNADATRGSKCGSYC